MIRCVLLLTAAVLSACGEPFESTWIHLSGTVYNADGSPAQGAVVRIVLPGCSWFCFGNDTSPKTVSVITGSSGKYRLEIDDGHLGESHTIRAGWGDTNTEANVTLTLNALDMHLPDLRQWLAEPAMELFPNDLSASTMRVSWKALPESYGVPVKNEHWHAVPLAKALNSNAEAILWEGDNGVVYPAEVISEIGTYRYQIVAQKMILQRYDYLLGWIGGQITPEGELIDYIDNDLDCVAQKVEEKTAGRVPELTDNDVVGSAWSKIEWVACEFPSPTTIAHVVWYGAYLDEDSRREPWVNIFIVEGDTLPAPGFWDNLVATRNDSFGLLTFSKPIAARWIILAPKGGVPFDTIAEVRAW